MSAPRFLLLPDAFKGTLSSVEVSDALSAAIRQVYPQAHIEARPMADGGEGTVAAWLALYGGGLITTTVTGPNFAPVQAQYGLTEDGQTAVIEMAAAAGLPLNQAKQPPTDTTSYGVGELMQHALDQGVTSIVLGLGGSATHDGGCGCAAALGYRFYDAQGQSFIPVGDQLSRIQRIDATQRDPRLDQIEVIALCDVDNPLLGPDGAAQQFAPQKGANAAMVERLERGGQHLAEQVARDLNMAAEQFAGAGAAGGLGFGCRAFFNAELRSGMAMLLDAMDFDALAQQADIIITGEGRLDEQSLRGKVVMAIARRARAHRAKVVAVVGCMAGDLSTFHGAGLDAVVVSQPQDGHVLLSKTEAEQNVLMAFEQFLRSDQQATA